MNNKIRSDTIESQMIKISDIRKVRGIGEKTIERIKDVLREQAENPHTSEFNPNIKLNPNSIYHGDCLELMNGIPDKSVDMILCDLPYGITQNIWDKTIDFDLLWTEYERVRSDNCIIALFGSEPFSSHMRLSNMDNFIYDWVWHKSKPSGMDLAKKQPMRNHEIISIFYQGNFYPIKEPREGFTESSKKRFSGNQNLGSYRNHGDSTTGLDKTNLKLIEKLRNPTTIKRFASIVNRNGTLHPTQKPVDLCEYLIKTYTNKGDLVLDNCIGSGTTAIAAINTNRRFIGIELESKYYKIAKNRVNNHINSSNLQDKYSIFA